MECHEIWEYNDKTHVQRLGDLVALCPACHQVKHFGLAQIRGKATEALDHLMRINNWTLAEAIAHVQQAFARWEERSRHEWTLDIDWLRQIGVEVAVADRAQQ